MEKKRFMICQNKLCSYNPYNIKRKETARTNDHETKLRINIVY